jgi:hypothetical protein
LKGILPANQNFQGGERLIYFQIDLFSQVEETHKYLQKKKKSVLEAAASSTLFPMEN